MLKVIEETGFESGWSGKDEAVLFNHPAAADAVPVFLCDYGADQCLPAVPTGADYDRRRTERGDAGHGGTYLYLRFLIFQDGVCGGVFLDFVCRHFCADTDPDEVAEKVGAL